ncbi:MAG: DoxX family protein [Acidobacteria bacterium]|nr:DoxX family protein [Acidobacteriota bacterium]
MVAVLFLQSAVDKMTDWKGNLGWLTEHFSKTFMGPFVPLLLGTILVMELTAGVLAAVGILYFVIAATTVIIFWSAVIAALALLSLFFGQRIAKDYPGAVSLLPYFILVLLLIYLTDPVGPHLIK